MSPQRLFPELHGGGQLFPLSHMIAGPQHRVSPDAPDAARPRIRSLPTHARSENVCSELNKTILNCATVAAPFTSRAATPVGIRNKRPDTTVDSVVAVFVSEAQTPVTQGEFARDARVRAALTSDADAGS